MYVLLGKLSQVRIVVTTKEVTLDASVAGETFVSIWNNVVVVGRNGR